MTYYIQGIGYYPIDVKHLPKETFRLVKIELLDLLIFKVDDNIWIQQNYVSGKIRVIIKTKEIKEKDQLEKECSQFVHEKIKKVFDNANEILKKQDEIKALFYVE